MNTNKSDVLAMVSRASLGIIPVVGPLAAEIVSTIIPNQRVDRLEKLLKQLESKIDDINKEKIESKLNSPEAIDLIEDSFIAATRALSDERLDYISSLLKNSLTEDQVRHVEYKRLLNILSQLNDIEVLILKSYAPHSSHKNKKDFKEKNKEVLHRPMINLTSTQDEKDKYLINQTYRNNLENLGLLAPRLKKVMKGELPEFDPNTGKIKVIDHVLTGLGDLLLRVIDQTKDIN